MHAWVARVCPGWGETAFPGDQRKAQKGDSFQEATKRRTELALELQRIPAGVASTHAAVAAWSDTPRSYAVEPLLPLQTPGFTGLAADASVACLGAAPPEPPAPPVRVTPPAFLSRRGASSAVDQDAMPAAGPGGDFYVAEDEEDEDEVQEYAGVEGATGVQYRGAFWVDGDEFDDDDFNCLELGNEDDLALKCGGAELSGGATNMEHMPEDLTEAEVDPFDDDDDDDDDDFDSHMPTMVNQVNLDRKYGGGRLMSKSFMEHALEEPSVEQLVCLLSRLVFADERMLKLGMCYEDRLHKRPFCSKHYNPLYFRREDAICVAFGIKTKALTQALETGGIKHLKHVLHVGVNVAEVSNVSSAQISKSRPAALYIVYVVAAIKSQAQFAETHRSAHMMRKGGGAVGPSGAETHRMIFQAKLDEKLDDLVARISMPELKRVFKLTSGWSLNAIAKKKRLPTVDGKKYAELRALFSRRGLSY